MSMNRTRLDGGGNYMRAAGPGDAAMDQHQVVAIATAGSGVLTAAGITAGIIERTGPSGAYGDTFDTADNIVAAIPQISIGDSFEFTVRNTVAFANTIAVSQGVELVGGNTAIAASLVRDFMITCRGNRRNTILSVNTTNASPNLTGLTQAQCDTLTPGMGVTGTGIGASAVVLAVNSSTGTVVVSVNSSATATVAGTFFPRFEVRGLRSTTL